jgi:hypothetical protein
MTIKQGRRRKLEEGLNLLREGKEPSVDAHALAYVADPLPEERAVLRLASALNDAGPKKVAVPWSCQEEAAAFFNKHSLSTTLDEIRRLAGPDALDE